jgi:hypothetical protein
MTLAPFPISSIHSLYLVYQLKRALGLGLFYLEAPTYVMSG